MKANLKNGKRARVMVTPVNTGSTLVNNNKTVFRPPVHIGTSSQATIQNSEVNYGNNPKTVYVCNSVVANQYLHKTAYKTREINCQLKQLEEVTVFIPTLAGESTIQHMNLLASTINAPLLQCHLRKQLHTPLSNDVTTLTFPPVLESPNLGAMVPLVPLVLLKVMSTTPVVRTRGLPVSQMWVDCYRPKSCCDVIGNDKAKAGLHLWFKSGHTKPCLITGPTGIGKTCLAESFFRDYSLDICDCRASGLSLITVVTNLLYRKRTSGMVQVGLVIDEIHTLTSEERVALGKLLSKTFPKSAPAIICIVDSDILQSQYSGIKAACHAITMYKPFEPLQDAKCLARKLQSLVKVKLSSVHLQSLVEQSLGDLRAVTIMMEWLTNTVKSGPMVPNTIKSGPVVHTTSRDLFLSPFEATRQLLRRPILFTQAEALVNADSLVPLFVFENGYIEDPIQKNGLPTLDEMALFAEGMSVAECFDSHRSHQLGHVSRSVLAAVVCVYYCKLPLQKRLSQTRHPRFPLYLGKCSTQNATSRYLKELRIRSYIIKRDVLSNGSTQFFQNGLISLREKLQVDLLPLKNADALSDNCKVIMSGAYDFVMDEIPFGILVLNKEDTVFLTQYKKRVK